ncbi:outer-membrane lipoprotein carrier protein LolA [Sphingomonas sabuli]|uniref:Outer-membrane lipoprotein carrier protein LolA n=1 Tax=Sphingomonas sabuli TaxID=2764186 RepID=A0A7G9L0D3_9SPHN|nr:outer membrane lipoprotein carrier protein LolA [Sphingomonas sabuli]QNM82082.1 outer-membrane lipoprotein carrier protein LolA [Sphingomonas sabuli]
MSFPTRFARALVPAAIVAVAAPVAVQAASTSADMALVASHLRSTSSMTANFVQTDNKGQTLSGSLKLKRPGRIRFEYAKGVNVLLVADGTKLNFIDYEVGQKSSWALNKTPLGVLLSNNPDLKRIARILPSQDKRIMVVRAVDPTHPEYGKLILAFIRDGSAPGGLKLYGWTAVDAQGKQTIVKLSNQRYNVAVPAGAFTYAEPKKGKRS